MTVRWLFVDEQPDEARACADLLLKPGEFSVDLISPEVDITFIREALSKGRYHGILLDHALNDGSPAIDYAGSTLAAFVRTEFSHLPIAVLSAKFGDSSELRRFRRTEELFDLTLDKQDLVFSAESIRRRLMALAQGYQVIHRLFTQSNTDDYSACCKMLKVSAELEDDTERATVARLAAETGAAEPSRVAHLLIRVALKLSGPLLDQRRAAVAAGLDPDTQPDVLEKVLAPAAYQGVFSELHASGRYWRELVCDLTIDSTELAKASCTVCGEEACELCEICKKPVDGIHSLPARRNEVANDIYLRARICGFCLDSELPAQLSIDGRYSRMRDALIKDAKAIQVARMQS